MDQRKCDIHEKKQEKVVNCWGKTRLLAIWDVDELASLVPKAFADVSFQDTITLMLVAWLMRRMRMRLSYPVISAVQLSHVIYGEYGNKGHNTQKWTKRKKWKMSL